MGTCRLAADTMGVVLDLPDVSEPPELALRPRGLLIRLLLLSTVNPDGDSAALDLSSFFSGSNLCTLFI